MIGHLILKSIKIAIHGFAFLRGMNSRLFLLLVFFCCACQHKLVEEELNLNEKSWDEIEASARGKELYMMMWRGDVKINGYMENYVAPTLKERYDIDLHLVPGQGTALVYSIKNAVEAGQNHVGFDIGWINGETFFQLRELEALYGPFVSFLPNADLIDMKNQFIAYDFQQETQGFECPWGHVQMALIYRTDKMKSAPKSLAALAVFVRENPGVFTFSRDFTGYTLLKAWLVELGGNKEVLTGAFDEELYNELSNELWGFINTNKHNFWKNGTTFPTTVSQLHQLYASGEVWFTMSNNDREIDNKTHQGIFPKESASFLWSSGTIRNTHYLGIPTLAKEKEAAMVCLNFLISPEAQLKKANTDVWGDGTVLDKTKLTEDQVDSFEKSREGGKAISEKILQENALMEPDPEYMIRLTRDFERFVLHHAD